MTGGAKLIGEERFANRARIRMLDKRMHEIRISEEDLLRPGKML